jgi:hypothetical protein
MQKVAGVSAVRVSLNEGLTVLDFKPQNTVTLLNLRQVIRNNGFVTREAHVVARGLVTAAGNVLTLEVSGSRETIALAPSKTLPSQFEDLRERVRGGQPVDVVITGTVQLSEPKRLRMTVESSRMP